MIRSAFGAPFVFFGAEKRLAACGMVRLLPDASMSAPTNCA
jgi:hypothetical protein